MTLCITNRSKEQAALLNLIYREATIEGNPRQTGKTRVAFILSGANQAVMTTLLKLVDEGNINGLAIIKSSLENDDD